MPTPVDVWAARVVDGCWIVFVIFWIAAAFSTKRTIYRQGFGSRAIWLVCLAIAYVLVVIGRRFAPLSAFFVPHVPATMIAAAIVCTLGLLVALWARVALGSNWSGRVTLKEGHEIVERGPYRFIRHPIYTGISMMALGTALLSGRVAALAGLAVIVAALLLKMDQEEKLLLTHFPADYAAYRRRAKRLIPFVW